MEIALLFFLILLNGIFALSEMALVSARKARLATLAAEGDKRAMAAIRLGEDPARIPSEGDIMEYADWRFEIVDMDGNRIDKVLVSPSKQKKDA